MGLFKHKDKTRPDLDPTSGPSKNLPLNPNPQQTSVGQNSFNDSTYYSSSDVSSSDMQKATQNQQRAQGKPPGTTVTTTTTTTTTTTVVTADGTTETHQHPYDPSTDPPPQQSRTTYSAQSPAAQNHAVTSHNTPSHQESVHVQAPTAPIEATPVPIDRPQTQRPQYNRIQTPPRKPTPQDLANHEQHELPTPGPLHPDRTSIVQTENSLPPIIPRSNSTSGGRSIPPRSELRNSTHKPDDLPTKSNLREDLQVQPLNTKPNTHHEIDSAIATSPTSPTMPDPRAHTPNFSRPDASTKKGGVVNAFKGLHGAGEAIRGTVNSTIARGVGDTAELERSRVIREQGMSEFRSSGLVREGFREKAENRIRTKRRSGSANPGEGQGHVLDRVDEVR